MPDAAINDLPGEIVASQSLAVDAKSGATFTSEGIVNAVADAVAQAGGDADALRAVPVEKELSTETIEMTTEWLWSAAVMGDDSPSRREQRLGADRRQAGGGSHRGIRHSVHP